MAALATALRAILGRRRGGWADQRREHVGFLAQLSVKLFSLFERLGWRSLRNALASI